jgi:hypothetical protein
VELSNKTIAIIMAVVGAFLLFRIISQWRGVALRKKPIDWDTHFIQGLRKAGVDTFVEHTVDFFFTVATREGAEKMASVLRAEGYQVDVLEAREISGQFSLHASRRMRLIVPDMQALTIRFNSLAAEHGGQYDNWAVVTKQ